MTDTPATAELVAAARADFVAAARAYVAAADLLALAEAAT